MNGSAQLIGLGSLFELGTRLKDGEMSFPTEHAFLNWTPCESDEHPHWTFVYRAADGFSKITFHMLHTCNIKTCGFGSYSVLFAASLTFNSLVA